MGNVYILTGPGCHALNQKPEEGVLCQGGNDQRSHVCSFEPNVALCMQTKRDSLTQKIAFAVLPNLRSLPVLCRPRLALHCTQDISQASATFQLGQLSVFKTVAAMDQQAPRTPFSPARSNLDVTHRPGGPASAAKSKKPKQQV